MAAKVTVLLILCFMIFLTACTSDNDNNYVYEVPQENGEYISIIGELPHVPQVMPYQVATPTPVPSIMRTLAQRTEIIEIISTDGYVLRTQLTMPNGDGAIPAIIVYVSGSGPQIFDNRPMYYDFWARRFTDMDIAFIMPNTRGVTVNFANPPFFVSIDDEAYQTYLPYTSIEDLYRIISTLRDNERLMDSQIILMGLSEGAIIAPLFAETHPDMVDALFLIGTPIVNLYDVLRWQASGGPSMAWYRSHFEADEYGRITREAFYADPHNVIQSVLGGLSFDSIDYNNDGFIDEQDMLFLFRLSGTTHMYNPEPMLEAIRRRDDEWLRENYGIPLTSGWFLEHFELRSNFELLPELDLPIYIFHGYIDQNVCIMEVYRLYERLVELGRENVTINTFPFHGHGLNLEEVFTNNIISDGGMAIFNTAQERIR